MDTLKITKTTEVTVEITAAEILEGLNGNAPFDRLAMLLPSVASIPESEIQTLNEAFPSAIPGFIGQLEVQLTRYKRIAGGQPCPLQALIDKYELKLEEAGARSQRSIRNREARLEIAAYKLIVADLQKLIGEPKQKENTDA